MIPPGAREATKEEELFPPAPCFLSAPQSSLPGKSQERPQREWVPRAARPRAQRAVSVATLRAPREEVPTPSGGVQAALPCAEQSGHRPEQGGQQYLLPALGTCRPWARCWAQTS